MTPDTTQRHYLDSMREQDRDRRMREAVPRLEMLQRTGAIRATKRRSQLWRYLRKPEYLIGVPLVTAGAVLVALIMEVL